MNIAKILKYCPKGTKLYSPVYGDVTLHSIDSVDKKFPILINDIKGNEWLLTEEGHYTEYPNSECVLFPSKDQRDWDEFRLPVKRGDIMMSNVSKRAFIASGGTINGRPQYICGINSCDNFQIVYNNNNTIWTSDFYIPDFYIPASEESKKELFDEMKEAGYKWNADTLELEKIESEFKKGDVLINEEGDLYLLIGKIAKDIGKAAILYANGDFIAEAAFTITSDGLTLAKSSARNKLFSFLIRKGYKYDKEQHKLIKQEFKPFDKVLVRNNTDEKWRINLFSRYDEKDKEYPFICMGNHYRYCTPYKGNEYLLILQYNF